MSVQQSPRVSDGEQKSTRETEIEKLITYRSSGKDPGTQHTSRGHRVGVKPEWAQAEGETGPGAHASPRVCEQSTSGSLDLNWPTQTEKGKVLGSSTGVLGHTGGRPWAWGRPFTTRVVENWYRELKFACDSVSCRPGHALVWGLASVSGHSRPLDQSGCQGSSPTKQLKLWTQVNAAAHFLKTNGSVRTWHASLCGFRTAGDHLWKGLLEAAGGPRGVPQLLGMFSAVVSGPEAGMPDSLQCPR